MKYTFEQLNIIKIKYFLLISILTPSVLLFCVLFSPNVLANPLNILQNEKGLLDKKKSELNSNMDRKDVELEINKSTINTIVDQIQTLDDNLVETNENVNRTESEINQTAEEIELLRDLIRVLEKNISSRDLVLRDRIRAIQVNNGSIDFFDVLLGSTSFADFFGRISTVNTLLEADRKIMLQQTSDVQQLEENRLLVSQSLTKQRNNKYSLQEYKVFLESQKNEKDHLILELKNQQIIINVEKSELVMEYADVSEKSNEISQEIVALQKRQTSSNQQNFYTSYSTSAICSTDRKIEDRLFFQMFISAGVFSGQGQVFINIASEYHIDPVLMAAIIFHETRIGTSIAVLNYNNPGGLMNPETNWSTLLKFDTLEDGLHSTGRTLNRLIHKGGLITIGDLGSVYAPIGAANDPTGLNKNWVPNVTKFVNDFGGLTENCKDL